MNSSKPHHCHLKKGRFALAITVVMAGFYLICTLFVAFWPGAATRILGWLLHLVDLDKYVGDVSITVGGFFIGLLPIVFYTFIGAWLFAWLHNKFSE